MFLDMEDMMRQILSALALTLFSAAAADAGAGALTAVGEQPGLHLAQSPAVTIGPNGVILRPGSEDYQTDRPRSGDRGRDRFQRYVCVVPPPQSSDRRRPYVCNADAGRIGERCRCPGTVGNGRLDFAR
jgi:hypothetical protein